MRSVVWHTHQLCAHNAHSCARFSWAQRKSRRMSIEALHDNRCSVTISASANFVDSDTPSQSATWGLSVKHSC
jgi:hypothetical protein